MLERDFHKQLGAFLEAWEDEQRTKNAFLRLLEHLTTRENLRFNFKGRPSVSYSLRAAHVLQQDRELFAIVDVIDEDPKNRWLSVCFYSDMITDPAERGELIPLGLLGEDGYCFNVEEWDEEYLSYLEERLDEAHRNASNH